MKHTEINEKALGMTRRSFLQAAGAGIVVLFTWGALPAQESRRPGQELPEDFNAFLRIDEKGTVSCFTGKIEMGQGVATSLAEMCAEELRVPFESVKMVMGDTDLCPFDMGTFGSMSTRFFGPPLRQAAATARAALLGVASERLGLPVENLDAENGVVFARKDPKKRLTYGEIAQGKRIERRVQSKPALKDYADFTIMGKPHARADAMAKVTGEARYAADIRLPGMLYAAILRSPVHGARLVELDTSAVSGEARVVRDGDLVALLAPQPDVAFAALGLIKARFEPEKGSGLDESTIFDHLVNSTSLTKTVNVGEGGDLTRGEAGAAHKFEATYYNAYVAHAPMETHAALASIEKGRATVWASTQTPFMAKKEVAEAIGLSPDKVRVITPFVGGGFGGKSANGQVIEAARLAKVSGRPVQVARTRQEEFFFDTFRPAAVVKIRSGMTDKGEITFWDYEVYFAGEGGAEQLYAVPNHREVSHGNPLVAEKAHPFATGPWRAPARNTNVFAKESHMDRMAAAIHMDPLEFRLKNLKDPRMIRVLRAAGERFGWKPASLPSGRGVGVACGTDAGTYATMMAEVDVDRKTGKVAVKRVVSALDLGICVNPEGARMQMEGGLTMGLGYALSEELHFKGGEILDTNFDTYEIPRFSWVPEIETVIIENRDLPPQGGGEPPIICTGAVIANAIFDATGARLTTLPMTPARVLGAMTA
jgi:isoquinoline 1-oxidoreductase